MLILHTSSWNYRVGSIWTASARDIGWSAPTKVADVAMGMWGAEQAGVVPVLRAVRASFPGALVGGARTVLHLRRRGDAWTVLSVPQTDGAVYSAIAAADAHVWIAYIAADRTVPRDANSVFLTTSVDSGTTWAKPHRLSLSGDRQATDVRLIWTPNSVYHALWIQNLAGGIEGNAVRHTSSRDGGATWAAEEDLESPDGVHDMVATGLPCGGVDVAFEHWNGRGDDGHIDMAPVVRPLGGGDTRRSFDFDEPLDYE